MCQLEGRGTGGDLTSVWCDAKSIQVQVLTFALAILNSEPKWTMEALLWRYGPILSSAIINSKQIESDTVTYTGHPSR